MATIQQVGFRSSTRDWRTRSRAGASLALGLTVAVVSAVAGIGLLYQLRGVGLLDVGPHVPGSLALERLAGGASQPLGRMAFAWVPVGVVAGLALRAVGVHSRSARAATVAIVAGTLLVVVGAVSDSVTSSSAVAGHLLTQLRVTGPWVATGLMVTGAVLVGARRTASAWLGPRGGQSRGS